MAGSGDRAQAGPLHEVGQLADGDVVGQRLHAQVAIGGEQDDFAHKVTHLACRERTVGIKFAESSEAGTCEPFFSSTFFLHKFIAVSRILSSFDFCSLGPSSLVKMVELMIEPFAVTHLGEGRIEMKFLSHWLRL